MSAAFVFAVVVTGSTPPFVDALERGQIGRALTLARDALEATDPEHRSVAELTELAALLELRRSRELRDALENLSVELGAFGIHLRASLLSNAGECDAATDLGHTLDSNSIYRPLTWARIAQCALRKRDRVAAENAIDNYESAAAADWQSADAALLRARLDEFSGDLTKARDLYRTLRVDHPFTRASASAKYRLDALAQRGLRARELSGAELLTRAREERARRRTRAARRSYQRIIRIGSKAESRHLRHIAHIGLAELEVVDYRYPRALKRLAEVVAESTEPKTRAHALYLTGDILSRRGKIDESLASYQRAVKEHPETAHALESALAAARLAYTHQRSQVAESLCRWLLDQESNSGIETTIITEDGATKAGRTIEGRHRAEAAWLLAWIAKRRTPNDDMEMLRWLEQIPEHSSTALGGRYWQARSALRRGDMMTAERNTAALLDLAPTDYYSLAARDRLCQAGGSCVHQEPSLELFPRPRKPPRDLAGLVTLFDAGLKRSTQRLLRMLPASGLKPVDRAYVAWMHARSGDIRSATALSRVLVKDPSLASEPAVLAFGHPRAFATIVRKESERSGVPEELIYAVMREESGFNPRALSPRGARGLMQMIPRTAKRMATSAGLATFSLRQLFRPETSVRLGAHYLKLLLQEFDGDLAAAIAAYHAGEKNVARWKERNETLSADEFIEEIPYASTRGYVKKVLGSYGTYRLLHRSGQRALPELFGPDSTSAMINVTPSQLAHR